MNLLRKKRRIIIRPRAWGCVEIMTVHLPLRIAYGWRRRGFVWRAGKYRRELRPSRRRRRHQWIGRRIFLPQGRRKNARILILDNHDDFGGHASATNFALAGAWC